MGTSVHRNSSHDPGRLFRIHAKQPPHFVPRCRCSTKSLGLGGYGHVCRERSYPEHRYRNIDVRLHGIFAARYPLRVQGRQTVSSRSEEHTSELQSLMRISYAVFCLKKQITTPQINTYTISIITYK